MILPHMFLYFLHVSMLLGMHARPQNNLILCGSFSLEAATTCNFNLHLVSWPHCPLGLCPHTCYYKKNNKWLHVTRWFGTHDLEG